MAQDFFDLLYTGYTGEYQLMSSLYRNGLDALRPPADMGIDVVSLNLKERLANPEIAAETFYFQVKTAVTSVCEVNGRPGAFATVEFKLKVSEVDLLARSRDRALFCYVYNSRADALTDAYETPHLLLARWRAACEGPRWRRVLPQGGRAQADARLPAAQARARVWPLVRAGGR